MPPVLNRGHLCHFGRRIPETEFSLKEFDSELKRYLSDYEHLCVVVDEAETLIRPELKDAFFAAVKYPVHAARAMAVKMLEAQTARSMYMGQTGKSAEGRDGSMMLASARAIQAYREIQQLTTYYNDSLAGEVQLVCTDHDRSVRRQRLFSHRRQA